jgi:hypothetical protein
MMHIARPAGTLMALVLLGACSASPTAPVPPAVTPPAVAPSPEATPVAGTRVFAFKSPAQPAQTVGWYTPGSRYVLYEDGRFALEYPHGTYRGTYVQNGAAITFSWEGSSRAGPWGAEGSLRDGQLTVRYNMIMMLSDFDDAIYALQPSS